MKQKFDIDPKDLPKELQDILLDKIGGHMFERAMNRSAEQLTSEDAQKFEDLLSREASMYEVISFMEEKVPHFNEIVKEETSKVIDNLGR